MANLPDKKPENKLSRNENPLFNKKKTSAIPLDKTIKVSVPTHSKIAALANLEHLPIWKIIDKAVTEYAEQNLDDTDKGIYRLLEQKYNEGKK